MVDHIEKQARDQLFTALAKAETMQGLKDSVQSVFEFEHANKQAGTAAGLVLNFFKYRRPNVLDTVVRERLHTALADLARDGEGSDATEAGTLADRLR
ncbi:MAG TPA: hypothetical protein VL137_01155 [Polyangiaceae bacterium]|jgi:hypothetical protein|nr:hypothetical protein [Polyangiaceae bacterium]